MNRDGIGALSVQSVVHSRDSPHTQKSSALLHSGERERCYRPIDDDSAAVCGECGDCGPPGARFSPDEDAAPAPLPTVSLSGFYERGFHMTRDGAGGQKFGRARAGTSREKFFGF